VVVAKSGNVIGQRKATSKPRQSGSEVAERQIAGVSSGFSAWQKFGASKRERAGTAMRSGSRQRENNKVCQGKKVERGIPGSLKLGLIWPAGRPARRPSDGSREAGAQPTARHICVGILDMHQNQRQGGASNAADSLAVLHAQPVARGDRDTGRWATPWVQVLDSVWKQCFDGS